MGSLKQSINYRLLLNKNSINDRHIPSLMEEFKSSSQGKLETQSQFTYFLWILRIIICFLFWKEGHVPPCCTHFQVYKFQIWSKYGPQLRAPKGKKKGGKHSSFVYDHIEPLHYPHFLVLSLQCTMASSNIYPLSRFLFNGTKLHYILELHNDLRI